MNVGASMAVPGLETVYRKRERVTDLENGEHDER